MDILINDFPEECFDKDVSPRLKKLYLSNATENLNEIQNQRIYKGAIMGRMRRMFISIPTAYPKINKFVNVHYLLDTRSLIITLAQRALCAIHQK